MITTTETTDTFRVIYTCRRKSCKHVFALEYRVEGTDRYGLSYGTRELKPGEQESNMDRLYGGRRQYSDDMAGDLYCPECGCNLPKSNRVVGHYNEQHVCNAKCMGATTGACSCSCGGANHGINHL